MSTLKSRRIHFADFVADLASGELFKDGCEIQLQDKPSQILGLLLQRPKEMVSRQEIISKVWPNTFVEGDLCLNVAIRRLRSALNDKAANADSSKPWEVTDIVSSPTSAARRIRDGCIQDENTRELQCFRSRPLIDIAL